MLSLAQIFAAKISNPKSPPNSIVFSLSLATARVRHSMSGRSATRQPYPGVCAPLACQPWREQERQLPDRPPYFHYGESFGLVARAPTRRAREAGEPSDLAVLDGI